MPKLLLRTTQGRMFGRITRHKHCRRLAAAGTHGFRSSTAPVAWRGQSTADIQPPPKAAIFAPYFRENLLFHKTFFAACGSPHLVEAIEQFAFKAHTIRSIKITYPSLLGQVQEEHAQMIRAIDAQDRRQLIKLVAAYIRPAKEAYLDMHRRISATS